MWRNRLAAIACAVLWALAARPANAQTPEPSRVFAGAGPTLAVQPTEQADGHYLQHSDVGGVSAGLHLTAGVHVATRWSAGVEATVSGGVSGSRVSNAGGGRHSFERIEHRESIVSLVARWHSGGSRWRFTPLGGVSWVRTRTVSNGETRYISDFFPPTPTASEDEDTRTAVTAGLDAAATLTRHLALTPFVRVHIVNRPQHPQETFDALPAIVYRAGVVVMGRW